MQLCHKVDAHIVMMKQASKFPQILPNKCGELQIGMLVSPDMQSLYCWRPYLLLTNSLILQTVFQLRSVIGTPSIFSTPAASLERPTPSGAKR
jgi:hypothetical protein